jgi:methyl-accepting chemotaxis protein
MQNASQGQGQQDENADTGQMALEQAQQMGDRIQDKTGKSLDRTRQQAKETLDIAANIEAQMNEQEEKLQGVGRDLDEMENSIARSKKLVGELAKAAAGDRCIQMICVLLVIGVIIMIVLFAMPKDSSAELKPE